MTDQYLRSLGFSPLSEDARTGRPAFARAWRYQHDLQALDGTSVFIEHPLGIDRCRLSATLAPLRSEEVFADMALQDRPALEAALAAFYQAHGGVGTPRLVVATDQFRPYFRPH
ncbi:hypothetical protein [Hymenobacter edaphi]|uniref:Uncharacterized protein n=1 Tax=Hymenobacter edaphi TaxID=2211146 RepID=A0A328BDP2_9BACT|nr:hypothetical protein [Hymenobacter edaphi]RAK64551.1 hypothetical protein DLM85_17805 [Hymenobacter edaphi]